MNKLELSINRIKETDELIKKEKEEIERLTKEFEISIRENRNRLTKLEKKRMNLVNKFNSNFTIKVGDLFENLIKLTKTKQKNSMLNVHLEAKFSSSSCYDSKVEMIEKFKNAIINCNSDLDKIFFHIYIQTRGNKRYIFEIQGIPLTDETVLLETGENLIDYLRTVCASNVNKDSFLLYANIKKSKLYDVQITLDYDLLNSLDMQKNVEIDEYVYDSKILKEAIMNCINVKNNSR